MARDPVRFVQISDSHLTDSADYVEHSNHLHANLRATVDAINRLSPMPGFVVHTGDIVNDETDVAYGHAAHVLSHLSVPLYCATGNHDDRQLLRKHMAMGPRRDLIDDGGPLCYRFEEGGEQFLVLDSQHPDGGVAGLLGDDQLDVVRELVREGNPFCLFLHHPPIETDCAWIEPMQLLNLETLHELLLPARDRLRAVFSGHIHRGTHTNRDGISYITVPATSTQLAILPDEDKPGWADRDPAAFNYVTILGDAILVKEYPVSTESK